MEEAADEELLLLELLEERERAEEAEEGDAAAEEEEEEGVANRVSPSEGSDVELSLPPPAPVPLTQTRTVKTNGLEESGTVKIRGIDNGGDVVERSLLSIPPSPAPMLSSQPPSVSAAHDRRSEWSSSRRAAGRRASAGNIGFAVLKETCRDEVTQGSSTRVMVRGSGGSRAGDTEQEKEGKETEPPGLIIEGQQSHIGLGCQVLSLTHHQQGYSTLRPVDPKIEPSGQFSEEAYLALGGKALSPDSVKQTVESSRSPPSEPRDVRGHDTTDTDGDDDDGSIVCVSPPNEGAGDEREESVTIMDPTIALGSIENAETKELRTGSIETAVVTLRHTFMTEVYESSSHGTNPDESAMIEPAIASDDESLEHQRPSTAPPEPVNEWITCVTDTGESYYYNPQTQESQWTPPLRTAQIDHLAAATSSSSPDDTITATLNSSGALFAAVAGVEPFASQLQMILQSGSSVHEANDAGLTPLHVACQCGNTNAASLLLCYGARPDGIAKSNDPQENSPAPPLFIACQRNQVELIQLLLDYGAPLNVTDRDGNSLLHTSIASQSQDALLYLLDLSISSTNLLNCCSHDGETPLHLAVKTGYADAVRALLRYGAATDVEDSLGRTPLVLSIMENQVECVSLLQTADEKPETGSIYESRETDTTADNTAAPTTTVLKSEKAMPYDANLDHLQAYIFQLLPSLMATPELQQAVYQFCNQSQQRMSSLTTELQILKQHSDEQKAQIEKITFQNAKVTEELATDQDELSRVQELLASQQLELDTLHVSHQALASRCEMLDRIARTAQEKLKRERAEHSHYEEQLQVHLRNIMDENSRLVTDLNALETKWNQWLDEQQQQQLQQSYAHSEEKSSRSGNEDGYYYHQYGEAVAQVYEPPQYYSSTAEGTGTLTPVDEPSEYYNYEYSNENESDDRDMVYLDDSVTHVELERMEMMKAPATSTPQPISPSRVGAVWNKFFENMAVAAERNQGSGGGSGTPPANMYQQHQQSRDNNTGYTSASGTFASSPASMFMAIRRSNFAELQQLLLAGMSPNVRDIGEKGTPLHLACELGDLDAMKLLCEFAADVEVRDESGNTPLLVACSQGHYECTKFLLQSAANLLAVNANGDSALHLAAWDGSADCVEILFEYGIDPLVKNNFALTALANIKTRSPLRHKFDDLVDEHPMRRTLVLLEEFEEQYEGQDDEEKEGKGDEHQEPERSTRGGDEQKSVLLRATKQSTSANQAIEKVETASKVSWKEWLFSFGAKPKQEEVKEKHDDQEERESDADDGDQEDSSQERQESSGDEDHDGEDEIGDATETTYSFDDSLRRYKPLKPPPDIEAELQRAKLQLQRPAMLATRNYTADDYDGDKGQPRSGREASGSSGHQQSFVAADRSRMTMAAQKKPTSSTPTSSHLRARYVDTFNLA